ncbi:MAG: GTPase Era [Rickettsiales bacterium]|nr:GTPase Era [Rickettsiales bacterium]
MAESSKSRCGFVAVLGAPNAGKSTLVNELVGAKVSIVTHKVQTTRIRIMGIAKKEECQIVFIDTPGIFEPRRRLDRAMVEAAWQGANDADRIMLIVDAKRGMNRDTVRILKGLENSNQMAVLVLNKIDLVKREELLAVAAEFNTMKNFEETFMISALRGDGVADILSHLVGSLPEGPWMFPENQISDLPQRLMAAEVTREYLFLQTHQEVPYLTTVETELWEEFKDGSIKIEQTIYVQRDSQKAIILGKKGTRLRDIGASARQELSVMFGCKVHLFIRVKVRDKWMDDRSLYRAWGLNFNA